MCSCVGSLVLTHEDKKIDHIITLNIPAVTAVADRESLDHSAYT